MNFESQNAHHSTFEMNELIPPLHSLPSAQRLLVVEMAVEIMKEILHKGQFTYYNVAVRKRWKQNHL